MHRLASNTCQKFQAWRCPGFAPQVLEALRQVANARSFVFLQFRKGIKAVSAPQQYSQEVLTSFSLGTQRCIPEPQTPSGLLKPVASNLNPEIDFLGLQDDCRLVGESFLTTAQQHFLVHATCPAFICMYTFVCTHIHTFVPSCRSFRTTPQLFYLKLKPKTPKWNVSILHWQITSALSQTEP